MSKKFFWSSYDRGRTFGKIRHRSKRIHEYDFESAVRLRKKVFLIILLLILVYLAYLFFYSEHFKITFLNISGQSEIPSEEAEKLVWESMKGSVFGIFPGDNYFWARTGRIQRQFDEQGLLAEVAVEKDFPHTLSVSLKDKLGQLVWIANEQFYVI